ncbi:MAG: hypothetical protein ACI4D4_09585, partial [Lachnospira sp.]
LFVFIEMHRRFFVRLPNPIEFSLGAAETFLERYIGDFIVKQGILYLFSDDDILPMKEYLLFQL